jgi:uncharacterized membrane protein
MPSLSAVGAAAAAILAFFLGRRFDGHLPLNVDQDSLSGLFGIFASGMLSVATFTVSAIVTAANFVATGTTPRATRFSLEDAKARFVLSSFIAAFIYSIIGILALQALPYTELGRFLLFIGLILIVVIVLVAFIQWIRHVRLMGRQVHTLRLISARAHTSLKPDLAGTFGAAVWDGIVPGQTTAVFPERVGFVSYIDTAELQRLAEEHDLEVIVTARPGSLADPTRPLLLLTGTAAAKMVAETFSSLIRLDQIRDDENEFRIYLLMLAETADRALSPGINDPGTAIAVLPLMLDILLQWGRMDAEIQSLKPRHPRVRLPAITADDLIDDCFTPIARDGATAIEVVVRLQKTLASLKRSGHDGLRRGAERLSVRVAERARHVLGTAQEQAIASAAREATAAAGRSPEDMGIPPA